jgi:transposase-like protein
MRRVPPSTVIREELDRLLAGGTDRERNIVSELMQLGLRYVAQQALEQEQTDFLGRGHYERAREHRGHRNGYEDATLRTAEGGVDVRVPQVRDSAEPFRCGVMSFLEGNSEVLEHLVCEMYARGCSTRDVEDAFRDPVSGELLISRSAVSEITDQLWEDYLAFRSRDLAPFAVEYLFLDGLFETLRRYGAKEGILAAWGVCSDGRKVLLHLAVGNKESEACWTEFIRDMQARGLRTPTTVTSDGAPGLVNAITACFSHSLRIRCWFHKLGNIADKLPRDGATEVMAYCRALRDAPTHEAGVALAAEVIDRFQGEFPSAMACLADDVDASLNHLKVPARHRITVRTTNLLERSFVEERRRSKVIPRFNDERSAMKLVFATLIRCSQRWSRVSITDLERGQLRLLRRELGIDPPPPTEDRATKRSRRRAA